MNKLMLTTALAGACAFAAFSAPVFAQTANDSSASKPAAVAAKTTPQAKAKTDAKRAVPAPGSRNCIRSTGSLLPAPKGKCLPVAGNSYSQEDLQRTGAGNVGQALQMLDPSIRVGGGH